MYMKNHATKETTIPSLAELNHTLSNRRDTHTLDSCVCVCVCVCVSHLMRNPQEMEAVANRVKKRMRRSTLLSGKT